MEGVLHLPWLRRRRTDDEGILCAELLPRQHFGADGRAGARALPQGCIGENFIALGSDYAWGRSSVAAFEEQIKAIGKNLTDKIFTPVANKDFSTYITKIMQSGAKDCYIALQGDEARGFFSQAVQYELPKRVQLLTEIVAQDNIRSLGKDSIGLTGSARYVFTYDIPQNKVFTEPSWPSTRKSRIGPTAKCIRPS